MIDLTIIGTFILDFQTVDFEPDSKIAVDLLFGWQKTTQMENALAHDPPVQSAGCSFAKVFLAGLFVEKVYAIHEYDVNASKGRRFEDKSVAWLQKELQTRGNATQITIAAVVKAI